jgi:hypothetical protein
MWNLIIIVIALVVIPYKVLQLFPTQLTIEDQVKQEEKLGNNLINKDVTQEVVADDNFLTSIYLYVATTMKDTTSEIELIVKDDREEVISKQVIYGGQIKDNSILTASFEPQVDSKGRKYTIYFKIPQAEENDGIIFWTSKDNLYQPGQLKIDNNSIEKDLTFRTTYKKGKYLNIIESFSKLPINSFLFISIITVFFILLMIFVFKSLNRYND